MTDYFALLGVDRAAVLDEDVLRERYHGRCREVHPDQASGEADRLRRAEVTRELNEAWEVLRRPASRLRHLLEVTAPDFAGEVQVSPALMDLFGRITEPIHEADVLLAKRRQASTPLGRALLSDSLMEAQKLLQSLLGEVTRENDRRVDELARLDVSRPEALKQAYGELSFLAKWQAQLQERILALLTEE